LDLGVLDQPPAYIAEREDRNAQQHEASKLARWRKPADDKARDKPCKNECLDTPHRPGLSHTANDRNGSLTEPAASRFAPAGRPGPPPVGYCPHRAGGPNLRPSG